MKKYNSMTNEQINNKIRELGDILECISPMDDKWDEIYKEYSELNIISDERYKEENQKDFDNFYNKNIKGKKWEEIDEDLWSFYSDWHKDMYGFRPKKI